MRRFYYLHVSIPYSTIKIPETETTDASPYVSIPYSTIKIHYSYTVIVVYYVSIPYSTIKIGRLCIICFPSSSFNSLQYD